MAVRRAAPACVRGYRFCRVCNIGWVLGVHLPAVSTVARAAIDVGCELLGVTRVRRSWSGHGRAWIEVRGLEGERGSVVAERVTRAVSDVPGVHGVELNRPLSRLVVTLGPGNPPVAQLCAVVDRAESAALATSTTTRGEAVSTADLPGDGIVLAGRVLSLGLDTAGLAVALAGRALRVPRIPGAAVAVVTLVDTQPRVRRMVERRLGADAADVVLAASTTVVHALSQSPASLGVDLALRWMMVGEARSARMAWQRHEPGLAEHAGCDSSAPREPRPVELPPGPVERYADWAATAGLAAAATVRVVSGAGSTAADAVLVAAPRAVRATRESFVATLSAGLATRDNVVVMRPAALRRLDRIDSLVVDPAALTSSSLSVSEVRGVEGRARARVWEAARRDVRDGLLGAGWHAMSALSPAHDLQLVQGVSILVAPDRDPVAEAVLAAARDAQLHLVSLDVAELGTLRSAFDDLAPTTDRDTDRALREAVSTLQQAGRTVALLAVDAPRAFTAADLGLAVPRPATLPAWTAAALLPDLAAAWRLLQAIPAARTASRRGVELAAGGSALGALVMLPGVRGRGPGPVTGAAAAGLLEGRGEALRVLRRQAPHPAPTVAWHTLTVPQALDELRGPLADGRAGEPVPAGGVSGRSGSVMRAAGGTWRAGRGSLDWAARVGTVLRAELADPLTPVLMVGAAASAVLGSPVDAGLVGGVVAANTALAGFQRWRAESQLRRLLHADAVPARLVAGAASISADGGEANAVLVTATSLRPGDLVEVRAGDVVPADGRLVDATGIEVDESSLTGESLPVVKDLDPTPGAPLAERHCMLYESTTVLTGSATIMVTAMGSSSAAGRADALAVPRAGDVGLQAQLGDLTSKVLPATLAAGGAVTAVSLLRGSGLRRAVAGGVSIAVAAVPEGLPLVATLAQQAAAHRLGEHQVLVRTPRAVEALGRVDVVCFDKTGTLSENRLQVVAVRPTPRTGATQPSLLAAAGLATPRPTQGEHATHATDAAVISAVDGVVPDRARELPFRPGRSFAAGLIGARLAVKGAPETVLAACGGLTDAAREAASAEVQAMAEGGLRVLAVAVRDLTVDEQAAATDDGDVLEALCGERLRWVGLLGLADTPRPDAVELLAGLRVRGIGVRLITGDHPVTAAAIATDLGMEITDRQVVTGPEWDLMPHHDRTRAVEEVIVFARMTPEHKVQVVQELERAGHVCAMVGDGANDAAAIRVASVGIGVSTRGSDPARGAADIVLTDGRIVLLLAALDEGGQLWRRVQAAVGVLLGGNAGEVAFTLYGTLLTGTSPLNARQLLLVNLLTDALPAAAVAVSPPNARGVTTARGLDRDDLLRTVLIRGAATTAGASVAWSMARLTGRPRRASTVGLVALVSTQLGQTFLDSRSPLVIVTAAGSLATLAALVSTPGISQLLGCTPLGPVGWSQALGSAAAATAIAAVAPRFVPNLARGALHNVGDPAANQQPVDTPNNGEDQHGQRIDGAVPQDTRR